MSTKKQEQIRCEKEGVEFVDNTLPVKPSNENKHYVKNADLRRAIMESQAAGKLTNEAIDMLYQLADKLSSKLKYNNPDDRDDIISFAMFDFCRYYDRYNPDESPNCFAYFTTIATNGFAKGWRALGKMKLPDSLLVSLSDNIYSI